MKTITISQKNFDIRMRTIATKGLKKYGNFLTFGSLYHYFSPCILEIGEDYITIDEEKYHKIRKKALANNL